MAKGYSTAEVAEGGENEGERFARFGTFRNGNLLTQRAQSRKEISAEKRTKLYLHLLQFSARSFASLRLKTSAVQEYTNSRWLMGSTKLWFLIFEIMAGLRLWPSPTSSRPCGL